VTAEQTTKLKSLQRLAQTVGGGLLCGLGFGFVMSLASNGFVFGVQWLSTLRTSEIFDIFRLAGMPFSLGPLISLLIAAMLVLLVRRLFGIQRWHGPADSIHAAHRTDNELDVKAGFGSTLAAFISASGGASVGQYGPLVHFGATMGSFIRRNTGGLLTTDIFIGCGVAGAISAGFNAPIAGLVFAHEAVLRHFSMRAITPIAVASISAAWFSDQLFSRPVLFSVDTGDLDLATILPSAMVAGPLFGILAVLFMNAVRLSARFAAKSGWSPARLLFVAAGLTGVVGAVVPEVLGLGNGPIGLMLGDKFGVTYLGLLLVLKLSLTALCIGFGLFGGVFSPALFVGAAGGAIGAKILSLLGMASMSPALAICGMAAVGAAVIGAPVAGILIILELTMSYEFALAAMLSIVVSIMISNLLFGHSFFDRQLLDRGIDVSQGRGHIEMMEVGVEDVVEPAFARIEAGASAEEALALLVRAEATEGYIVDADGGFLGKVSLHALLPRMASSMASAVAESEPISIKHDASLLQAIEVASGFVGESIPVINRDTGEMLGIVTEADLFKLYLNLQTRISDLERT